MSDIKETLIGFGNPEKVGEILELLRISTDDLKDGKREDTIRAVVDFLVNHPDPAFFVRKAVGSKQVDRVDFLNEYIQFHSDLQQAQDTLSTINQKLEMYDTEDLSGIEAKVYETLVTDKQVAQQKVASIQQEIQIYER